MVCCDGMATMTHRTTFAFYLGTILRLKQLSSRWHVCQAEVIRRALSQAEAESSIVETDPVQRLRAFHASGNALSKKVADAYVKKVYADRKHWRD